MRKFFFIVLVLACIGGYLYYFRGWDLKRLNQETIGRIPIAALHPSTNALPLGSRGTGTHWEEGARALTARAEGGAAAIDDHIYLVGGADGYGRTLDSMEIYDTVTDTWSLGPKMPQALHHPAVTTDGRNLYVIGGLLGISSTPIDQAWTYDTVAKTWHEISHLNDFRGGAAAAYLGGKVYVIGGLTNAGPTSGMEVYDPATGAWTIGESMPTARTGLTAFTLDDTLYAVGGTRGGVEGNLANVEAFDTRTGKWKSLAPLAVKRSDITSAVVNGVPYVFGGEGANGTIGEVERYDAAKNVWKTQPEPLPTPRHGLSAVNWKNRAYVLVGGNHPGFAVGAVNDVLIVGTTTPQTGTKK